VIILIKERFCAISKVKQDKKYSKKRNILWRSDEKRKKHTMYLCDDDGRMGEMKTG
jgi:hypothetical protein